MKKIIMAAIFAICALLAAPFAGAESREAADLIKLKEAGLSESTLSRFLSQNLSQRSAPPVDPQFLARLAGHGGDHLARTYLDLDRLNAHERHPRLSQGDVDRLIKAKTPPAEIQLVLGEEISRYERENKLADARPLMPPALPPAASADSRTPEAYQPPAPAPQAAPAVTLARVQPPTDPALLVSPRLPESPARPAAFQDLRPGQAADPASRLPLPYSTYDFRGNRQAGDVRRHNPGGAWMGVVEKELPDGHWVEANSIGQTSQVGQEVYARPSGHKVYRYFSGNPDAPHSGADPRQEAINRDQLNTIFQNRSGRGY